MELQIKLIVLFKPPRDVLQIDTLSQHLGPGSQLGEWYQDAISIPYGHLLIDLTQKTIDSLKYCTKCGSFPSKFYQNFHQSCWTMSIQNFSMLPIFQTFSQKTSKIIHPP